MSEETKSAILSSETMNFPIKQNMVTSSSRHELEKTIFAQNSQGWALVSVIQLIDSALGGSPVSIMCFWERYL